MNPSHTGFAPSKYISQQDHNMSGLSPQMFMVPMPMQYHPNSFYPLQKTPEQNGMAHINNYNQHIQQYLRFIQEQQEYQHQFSNQQFLQSINYYSPPMHQINHTSTNGFLLQQPLKSQSALNNINPSIQVKIEDSDLNSNNGISKTQYGQQISQQAIRQSQTSQYQQQQQQQHQVETDSTTGERSQAAEDDMHVRPTSNTVLQQRQQLHQEDLLKIKILPTLKRSYQVTAINDVEEPSLSKKVCCVSMIKNKPPLINNNIETVQKSVEIISQFRPKDRQRKNKQDYYNDSNYTKNLLKGFKRYMIRFGEQQEGIVMSEFEAFFDKEPLNNELILKCFAHDVYNESFNNFLSQDPTWWVNEARIKDTEKQIAFFQLCQERNFSSIKTKRKSFQRPLI